MLRITHALAAVILLLSSTALVGIAAAQEQLVMVRQAGIWRISAIRNMRPTE